MAFYKLMRIIHRRTDFDNMRESILETMYPEVYAAARERRNAYLSRMLAMNSFLRNRTGSVYI